MVPSTLRKVNRQLVLVRTVQGLFLRGSRIILCSEVEWALTYCGGIEKC